MARIIFFICAILVLSSCTIYDAKIEQGQEVTIEKTSFSFDDKNYDFFSEYRISPGDELDVLFSIRSWEKEVEYRVSIGDTIDVKFLNATKYNATQKIRTDGKISLPFIGDYEVAGKSAKIIQEKLTAIYADIFKHPNILIVIPEYLTQLRELKTDLHTASRGLSRLVTVRPDGYTTFPMLGEFEVGNKTIKEVMSALNLEYAKISPSFKVDLFLEKHSGSVFYALGDVLEQGAHELRRPISILEALSLAKGKKETADIEEVIVYRRHNKEMVATRVNVADMLTVANNSKMFFIYKDDIVYIPEADSSQIARAVQRIASIIMFRGWNVNFGLTGNIPMPLFGSTPAAKSNCTYTYDAAGNVSSSSCN